MRKEGENSPANFEQIRLPRPPQNRKNATTAEYVLRVFELLERARLGAREQAPEVCQECPLLHNRPVLFRQLITTRKEGNKTVNTANRTAFSHDTVQQVMAAAQSYLTMLGQVASCRGYGSQRPTVVEIPPGLSYKLGNGEQYSHALVTFGPTCGLQPPIESMADIDPRSSLVYNQDVAKDSDVPK